MIKPQRALFIQLRKMGDTLLCTPAIRAFKNIYPDCRLDFLTEHPDILKGNPRLNQIIPVLSSKSGNLIYQLKLINSLRAAKYDLVADFFVNPRSAYYTFLSGARIRLSYGYRHRRWAYNVVPPEPKDQLYAADYKLRLLEAIAVPSDGPQLDFYIDDSARLQARKILPDIETNLIALSPVSYQPYNRWPLDRYAEIGNRLIDRYKTKLIILSGPGEHHLAEDVSRLMGNRGQIVLNIDNLELLGAVFEKASLYFGNDNGTKHIAVACQTPTFSVYGPQNPISWTFPDSNFHQWVIPTETYDSTKREHISNSLPIENISIEYLWQKLETFIDGLPKFQRSIVK